MQVKPSLCLAMGALAALTAAAPIPQGRASGDASATLLSRDVAPFLSPLEKRDITSAFRAFGHQPERLWSAMTKSKADHRLGELNYHSAQDRTHLQAEFAANAQGRTMVGLQGKTMSDQELLQKLPKSYADKIKASQKAMAYHETKQQKYAPP